MSPELADRVGEAMAPVLAAYLEAKAEVERTGQTAVRPIPGGCVTVRPEDVAV